MISIGHKILLPYEQIIVSWTSKPRFARRHLFGGYNHYITTEDSLDGDKWSIISNDYGTYKTNITKSKNEAMRQLDEILIANECKLLNTKEEADKYRCLL